jgi:hypothetical protein
MMGWGGAFDCLGFTPLLFPFLFFFLPLERGEDCLSIRLLLYCQSCYVIDILEERRAGVWCVWSYPTLSHLGGESFLPVDVIL